MSETPETPPSGPSPPIRDSAPSDISDRKSDIFFAAVETTRMPMIVTDPRQPDNPIIFVNRAFERMTEPPRQMNVGRRDESKKTFRAFVGRNRRVRSSQIRLHASRMDRDDFDWLQSCICSHASRNHILSGLGDSVSVGMFLP